MTISGAQLVLAVGPPEVAAARALFVEYQAKIGVDLCFQGFAAELAALPGDYAPPNGRLFLARVEAADAGCIALHPLADGVCEMKRLYVREAFRGRGLGRLLVERAIAEAKEMGYRAMRLDTLASMREAAALYRSCGFAEIAAYRFNPEPGTLFFERGLSGAA